MLSFILDLFLGSKTYSLNGSVPMKMEYACWFCEAKSIVLYYLKLSVMQDKHLFKSDEFHTPILYKKMYELYQKESIRYSPAFICPSCRKENLNGVRTHRRRSIKQSFMAFLGVTAVSFILCLQIEPLFQYAWYAAYIGVAAGIMTWIIYRSMSTPPTTVIMTPDEWRACVCDRNEDDAIIQRLSNADVDRARKIITVKEMEDKSANAP